jgi:hypothetical protein
MSQNDLVISFLMIIGMHDLFIFSCSLLYNSLKIINNNNSKINYKKVSNIIRRVVVKVFNDDR